MRVKPKLWVIPMLIAGCATGEAENAEAQGAPAPAPAAAPAPAPATTAAAAPAPAPAPTAAAPAAGGAATIWDGVYTAEQASRGEETASTSCFACHSASEWTRPVFLGGWNGRPVQALWQLIRATMPYDSPGGLTDQEYSDLVAYILELNGVPAGATELPSDQAGLAQITFAARN